MRRRDFLASVGLSSFAGASSAIAATASNVPTTHEADVVVVGAAVGGLGGCFAAIAAARQGAKVVLIEEAGHVQLHTPLGLGVVLGVKGWQPTIREGLFREFAERVAAVGQFAQEVMTSQELLAKGEMLIRYHDVVTTVLLQMLLEAKVQLLFHTRPVGVEMEDASVRRVIVQSPQGRHAVAGKAFVDSTGLGDLAFWAGAPMKREEPYMGLQALIGKVDSKKYYEWVAADKQPLDDSYRAWLETIVGTIKSLPHPWEKWWTTFLGNRFPPAVVRKAREAVTRGELTLVRRHGKSGVMAIPEGIKANGDVAMPRSYVTGIDPTEIDQLNWAENESRLALLEFYTFLRKNIPGFEQAVIERVADEISLRGGRYIETDVDISEEVSRTGGKHADCIFLFARGDKHKTLEVPFSALVPKRVKNLLVVGKSTAGGAAMRAAHGVLFQGQAAGIAAAMAAKSGRDMGEVDIKALQKILKAAGVEIPY